MILFWASFVTINVLYCAYLRDTSNARLFHWHRKESTEYIPDRSCVQLSYIWNYGAPRGCEVTTVNLANTDWAKHPIPKKYWEAPTSVLLHEVYTPGGPFPIAKLFYFIFLCVSGFFVVYKHVYPLFDIKWPSPELDRSSSWSRHTPHSTAVAVWLAKRARMSTSEYTRGWLIVFHLCRVFQGAEL